MKYIIELEDMGNGLYKAKGANTLVFDKKGIENILQPYKEPQEEEMKFPQVGDMYWYIDCTGILDYSIYRNSKADNGAIAIGNIFETKEDAKFVLEQLKVLAEMKKFAEPKDRPWNEETIHFEILADEETASLVIFRNSDLKRNAIYFQSEEKVQECIDKVGADRIKRFYCGLKE